MISLERVDPSILKQIREQAIQEIVHTKKDTGITREEAQRPKSPPLSKLLIKKKIKDFNRIFKKSNINIFLELDEGEEQLSLQVVDKETRELLRRFNDEEVEEILMKLENFLGIFIDDRI